MNEFTLGKPLKPLALDSGFEPLTIKNALFTEFDSAFEKRRMERQSAVDNIVRMFARLGEALKHLFNTYVRPIFDKIRQATIIEYDLDENMKPRPRYRENMHKFLRTNQHRRMSHQFKPGT